MHLKKKKKKRKSSFIYLHLVVKINEQYKSELLFLLCFVCLFVFHILENMAVFAFKVNSWQSILFHHPSYPYSYAISD